MPNPSEPFSALEVGARFVFASESVPGYGGARGPWRKLSPRRYVRDVPPIDPAHPRLEFVHRVGTVKVATLPAPPLPDPVICERIGANVFGRLDCAARLIREGKNLAARREILEVARFLG